MKKISVSVIVSFCHDEYNIRLNFLKTYLLFLAEVLVV